MPRVVIKEYDNTTAASANSDTFAVVIPGFIKSGTHTLNGVSVDYGKYSDGTSVFDENGVYACDSQSDFEDYIGLTSEVGADAEAT